MRRLALAALATVPVLSFSCGREPQQTASSTSTSTAAPEANVLLLLKAADNPFFQEIERGARQAIASSGRTVNLQVRSGESESDVAGQRKVLEWYYAQYGQRQGAGAHTAVLITPSASQKELTDQLLAFQRKGIPVVLLDTRIDQRALDESGLRYTAYFGSNNREGGKLAADELLRAVPNAKRVLFLGGVEGQETAAARREGFRAEVAAAAPGAEITERTCNWRRNEARRTVEALLAAGSRFDAVFAANDEMALGAVEAVEASGASNKPKAIIGFDAIPAARAAVDKGRLTATIAQSPFDMGRMAIGCVLDPHRRTAVMVDQDVPLQVVRR